MALPTQPRDNVTVFSREPFVGRTPGQGEREITGETLVGQQFYVRDNDDKHRILRYSRWDALATVHSHHDDFVSLGADITAPAKAFWIPIDFFGMLSRLMRHYTFGMGFFVKGVDGNENDDEVRRIFTINRLGKLLNQAAEQVTTLGDTVLRVDVEMKEDDAGDEIAQAVIKSVHPAHFFPELDPLDTTRMVEATLAWVFDVDEEFQGKNRLGGTMVVLLEIHTPGHVNYELHEWDGTTLGRELSVSSKFPELEDGETGIDEIALVHVGTGVLAGQFWGTSEYDRVERIVLAIENRIAQLDEVLDKHARPKLIVGPGVLGPDGQSRLAQFDIIEIEPAILEKAVKPEYLTWDMQIGAIQHEIEKLEEYLFITTETSPASFGLERDGSQVESARALRFKAHRTVNKVNDLRQTFACGIRDVFRIAQKMENAAREEDGGDTYERGPILLVWPDPIIEDQDAEVQQYVNLKSAGLVSSKRAIRDLHGLNDLQADAEVQEILQDKVDDAASAGTGAPLPLDFPETATTASPPETPAAAAAPGAAPAPVDLTEEAGLGVAEDIQKTLLNGAQVSSMVSIVTQVAAGALPRDAGLKILETAFGVSALEAEDIMGESGLGKPEPDPLEEPIPDDVPPEPSVV